MMAKGNIPPFAGNRVPVILQLKKFPLQFMCIVHVLQQLDVVEQERQNVCLRLAVELGT
jgi:hypothetical protein